MSKKATPQDHARLSPSGAERWMECPGSLAMCKGIKDVSSTYAEEGTVAHEVAALCLQEGLDPWDFFGAVFWVWKGKIEAWKYKDEKKVIKRHNDSHEYLVEQDMVEYVTEYVENIQAYEALNGARAFYEQKVDFSSVVGVPDSFGTSDAIILTPDEWIIGDLKYGRGVLVNAEENKQLMIYALGALNTYDLIMPTPPQVRLVIHMPRLEHLSEWVISTDDLIDFGKEVRDAAHTAIKYYDKGLKEKDNALVPGEKQCRFCRAKAICPALNKKVTSEIIDAFDDEDEPDDTPVKALDSDDIAEAHNNIPLVEMWIKAVKAELYRRLMDGKSVEGYKLIEGRKGNRKWVGDEKEIEKQLKKWFDLDEDDIYTKSFQGPPAVEKLVNKKDKKWKKLTDEYVTQNPGKPSVAKADAKGKEYTPGQSVVDAFDEDEED